MQQARERTNLYFTADSNICIVEKHYADGRMDSYQIEKERELEVLDRFGARNMIDRIRHGVTKQGTPFFTITENKEKGPKGTTSGWNSEFCGDVIVKLVHYHTHDLQNAAGDYMRLRHLEAQMNEKYAARMRRIEDEKQRNFLHLSDQGIRNLKIASIGVLAAGGIVLGTIAGIMNLDKIAPNVFGDQEGRPSFSQMREGVSYEEALEMLEEEKGTEKDAARSK